MIVINFILKVILKVLLMAALAFPITIPIGYVAVRGMVFGWDNMGKAWSGAVLIFALMIVVFSIVAAFKKAGTAPQSNDHKSNTFLDEDDSLLSSDDTTDYKWDDDYAGMSLVEAQDQDMI
jgi:uncharacterized membrane protein